MKDGVLYNLELVLKQKWIVLSIISFLVGLLLWVPNFINDFGYGYWLWTFLIGPIGVVFGYLARSIVAIVLNTFITFSFFIFMFIGSLWESIY
ncbi:hypothetical conserved protein [Oceanobacillus iheyensis HTE831]|uniref:Hypothetical conserved protein n=1 Tax=Oceanobacillus iheyensis (strain DSM 14371 / CIP 107618 / JCM 11309 / KCTC 3954 / HTE831) TaxID=221109 RepID=Q8ERN8_OCEIH|nr:hypothetical protein [Oceanobacillus iheyensis]BAC13219.1 hypothetical conserved protein [Oceanobacillus iheyensis HTE831]